MASNQDDPHIGEDANSGLDANGVMIPNLGNFSNILMTPMRQIYDYSKRLAATVNDNVANTATLQKSHSDLLKEVAELKKLIEEGKLTVSRESTETSGTAVPSNELPTYKVLAADIRDLRKAQDAINAQLAELREQKAAASKPTARTDTMGDSGTQRPLTRGRPVASNFFDNSPGEDERLGTRQSFTSRDSEMSVTVGDTPTMQMPNNDNPTPLGPSTSLRGSDMERQVGAMNDMLSSLEKQVKAVQQRVDKTFELHNHDAKGLVNMRTDMQRFHDTLDRTRDGQRHRIMDLEAKIRDVGRSVYAATSHNEREMTELAYAFREEEKRLQDQFAKHSRDNHLETTHNRILLDGSMSILQYKVNKLVEALTPEDGRADNGSESVAERLSEATDNIKASDETLRYWHCKILNALAPCGRGMAAIVEIRQSVNAMAGNGARPSREVRMHKLNPASITTVRRWLGWAEDDLRRWRPSEGEQKMTQRPKRPADDHPFPIRNKKHR